MEEKKTNSKMVTYSIIAVLLVVIATIGATFAYFSSQAETGEQTVTTATLGLEFGDDSAVILASNISPITTDKVLTDTTNVAHKTFKLKKTANSSDVYTTIKLTNLNVPEKIAEYDLKWMLYKGQEKIATGDFGGKTSGEIVIATNELINSTTGIDYDLYIWINETGVEQNDMQEQTLTATITAVGLSTKQNTLASLILGENNANVTTAAPTFIESSTDSGLYVQQDDTTKSEMGFPTYYYRGSSNNYVSFGTDQNGKAIKWRVVRINEDGSIRLIYDDTYGTIGSSISSFVRYINEDGTDSSAKSAVETWYNTNIGSNSNLDNKVVTSTFCNDISGNYTAAKTRLTASTPSPIFTCPVGAINVYEKVGLLTADEAVYAGALINKSGTNYPSISGSNHFWMMTPYNTNESYNWEPRGSYVLTDGPSIGFIRPVINLSPDVIVSNAGVSNAGSYATPYIIQ